jgi:hypothetical protein
VDVLVCAQSGQLKTAACPTGVTLTFLEGTQPAAYCDMHISAPVTTIASSGLNLGAMGIDDTAILQNLRMPELDLDFLPPSRNQRQEQQSQTNTRRNQQNRQPQRDQNTSRNQGGYSLELPSYNPLLD